MSRPLAKEIANLDGAIGKFGKFGKRLGVVGAALTAGSLTYKYFNGGITRKDALDGAISGVLLLVTVTNPVGLIALGAYGLLYSMGTFDGIKEHFGIDNKVILKH